MAFYESPNPAGVSMVVQTVPTAKVLPKPKKSTVGLPVRLKIPSIKVNAIVQGVGLTPHGSMGVPSFPLDTAWYMLGPKPGEKGSAVISGHVDWWYGATGVFEHLNGLKPGDIIVVQDTEGSLTTFVVRTSRTLAQTEDASEVFRSYDGRSHLNLITCAGAWDRATQAYTKRLVVFADKLGE